MSDGADVRCASKLFQRLATETGKARLPTLQKLNTTQKKQTTQDTAKQNWPGLVVSYDTRPGNEVGLFYNAPEPTRMCSGTRSQWRMASMFVMSSLLNYNTKIMWCTVKRSLSDRWRRVQHALGPLKWLHGTRPRCLRPAIVVFPGAGSLVSWNWSTDQHTVISMASHSQRYISAQ